ncbi:unnamed protein product [Angiostrongylus costaricensis]|uniref:Peptidase_M13_N domain-containing protein n=1 Tax=Angiostrongylus costaricensis TaxID=334426 RepID=A0A0R3Q2I6_ANGCS|nr:unnamed protein product [Angiostrongylus costaricensis]
MLGTIFQDFMLWLFLLIPCDTSSTSQRLSPSKHKTVGWDSAGDKIASEMLSNSINFSVDPCEDFFEFTCGNWKARHPIPSYRSSYSQFSVLHDKVQAKMREIFESEEVFPSKSVTALKLMYRRCMDQHELNRIGARKLIESIRNFGEWPMLEGNNWRADQFDLTTLFFNIAAVRGVHIFIDNYLTIDNRNVSRRLVEVKLFHEDVGLPVNGSKIANDVDEIIDLETKMAQILVAEKDRRNYTKMYNLRHLSELQTLMPLIDWYRYFPAVAPAFINDYLAGNPKMLIIEIDYMRRVNRLISSTDPRIITNYAYLRYTLSWSGELGMRYEDIYQVHKNSVANFACEHLLLTKNPVV